MTDIIKRRFNKVASKYSSKQATMRFVVENKKALGFKVSDAKKVAIRDEKTPSANPHKNLRFYDFGLGETVNLLDALVQFKGLSPEKAIKKIEDLDKRIDVSDLPSEPEAEKPEKKDPYSPRYLWRVKKEAEENKKEFWTLLRGLCRSCTVREMGAAIRIFDIGYTISEIENKETGELTYEERLFIPEKDIKGIAWNAYRYNRSLDPKGKFRYQAKRVLFGSHLIPKYNPAKPIFCTEGHSDCIVNVAKGIQSVSTGSASTAIGKDGLNVLAGKKLDYYPDTDEAGIIGACKKILEIAQHNKSVSEDKRIRLNIIMWSSSFEVETDEGKRVYGKKEIYGIIKDFIERRNKSLSATKEEISCIPLLEESLKEWKFLSEEPVESGFDAIDFHQKNATHPKYQKWKSRYTF